MYFVNNRKKLSFSFLTFIIVLLSIVSITFGTIGSSANSAANEKKQEEKSSASDLQGKQIFSSPKKAKPFSFLSNHLTTFFNGNNIGQTSLISHSSQSKENAIADSPVFNQFNAWISLYISNGLTANSEQMNFGEDLAVKRKQLLKELIQLNPKAALEKAIPAETFNRLPSFITENSEKRISAYGDFNVYILDERDPLTGKMTGSRIEREVIIGDSRYKAFVYGRREAMTTKLNIPLQGIVIDDIMIVDENPLRKMDSAEYTERAVDESALGADGIAAEVGGKVVYFSNQSELSNFAAEQIEWESKIGPVRPEKNLAPEEPASAWTEGAKTVLFIRVDFSDRPGEPTDYNNQPLTITRAQNLFTNEVNPFYINNSYNKTSLQATVTPVLRLPQTQVYYTTGSNYNIMITDARNAASQAGYNTNNFNLDIVGFSYTTRLGWVGLASIGAKGNLLNGAFYMQETSHELGHNYGLLHANLWRTTDGTVIGQGSNDEYGDCFDVMGRCYNESQSLHFNTRYKRLLDWLTDANVQTVTSNGIYRIVAQDSPSPGGIRTLKIRKDDIKNYWIEFRQLSPFASNGALLRWDYLRGNLPETQLLDMKPNTTGYFDSDSALLIGQSFYDSISQIRITVIGKGNTNPESLDVMVELGQSTGGCTYTLSPTSANIGVSGGTGSVNITAPSDCSWTANSNQTFVTITSGGSGSGNGTVNYSVAANIGSARSATITIAGQIFTIQQAGATIGSYTLVASPITIAPGGQLAVSFTAPGGSSLLDWVALYRVGALNTEYLDGGYTNGATSGTFNLTAPTQPGQYEFRYLLNNTFTSVITSNTITVQSTPTPSPTPTPPPTPTPMPTPTPQVCTPFTTITEGDLFPSGIVSFGVSSGPGSVTVDHVNAGTGLQSLTVVGVPVNAVVNIPPFTPGTFNPVVVTFTTPNPGQAVDFTLRAASTFHAANTRVRCSAN